MVPDSFFGNPLALTVDASAKCINRMIVRVEQLPEFMDALQSTIGEPNTLIVNSVVTSRAPRPSVVFIWYIDTLSVLVDFVSMIPHSNAISDAIAMLIDDFSFIIE